MQDLQTYFDELSQVIQGALSGSERYTANFSAENSDFVRFNKSEVRQAGSVQQRQLSVDLIDGQRHCAGGLQLAGELEQDRGRVQRLVAELRERLAHVPEDPYLLVNEEPASSENKRPSTLPEPAAAIDEIQQAGKGRDLVGVYASGDIYRGFANSLGQRNWHAGSNFNFDWSFYHQADKAVKSGYAGFEWQPEEFGRKVNWAGEQLEVLKHPGHTIEPGRYRVYLSPAALNEIIGILCWGGFGLKAHRTKQTPLLKMISEGLELNPGLSILEHTAAGVAPNFQEQGFVRPDQVTLIDKGRYADCLVSPRSAREYGVPTNGASASEAPDSIELSAGGLPQDEVLEQLGTGIYVGNLWYLNWSDRPGCRTTGMTRFGTFWVEGGKIVAPLNVMRFDETAYRMLGQQLVDLTAEREVILDAGTYMQRAVESATLPGALVEEFTLTL